ncbi:MAG TPA: hypothetical protein VIM86_00695 [Thermodesulfobacteriota bacterium]
MTERVEAHAPPDADRRIEAAIRASVRRHATADDTAGIEGRLRELDREWDVERLLTANASLLSLAGLVMGKWVDRRFYLLPAVAQGFLLQHALRGWCPPVSLLRRLGIRTRQEIDRERYALKAVRGDFTGVRARHADAALEATTR